MKKNFLLILFVYALSYGQNQTATYSVDNSDIINPERGFYHHTETHSSNYDFLSASSLSNMRNNEKISLILRVFYLEAYVNGPIAASYLSKVQTDFDAIRASGVKTIIRFAYSDNNQNANPKDAPKDVVLGHIQQLKSVIYANRDVINSLQVGFVGVYGEWYYSENYGTTNLTNQNLLDRQEILLSVLENFGWDIQIQVRTPKIKQNIFGSTPITESQAYNLTVLKTRVGHYNDCFLADANDTGTFNNDAERTYLENDARYTVNGGETCQTSTYTTCSNALDKMNKYSFDFLNTDYYPDVVTGWKNGGCFDEMKKRLGYRLEMISSTLTPTSVTVNIRNTGFGHLANERRSYIVYRNVANGNEISLQIDGDARLWIKGATHTITQVIPLLPVGTYHLYLNLPDIYWDVMGLDERYSVRMANLNTWEAATGYNDLQLTHTVTALSIADFIANTSADDFRVELFDMSGRSVTSKNLESLPKGIYIIRRTTGAGAIETKKIII
jgi:hypothetical protein